MPIIIIHRTGGCRTQLDKLYNAITSKCSRSAHLFIYCSKNQKKISFVYFCLPFRMWLIQLVAPLVFQNAVLLMIAMASALTTHSVLSSMANVSWSALWNAAAITVLLILISHRVVLPSFMSSLASSLLDSIFNRFFFFFRQMNISHQFLL